MTIAWRCSLWLTFRHELRKMWKRIHNYICCNLLQKNCTSLGLYEGGMIGPDSEAFLANDSSIWSKMEERENLGEGNCWICENIATYLALRVSKVRRPFRFLLNTICWSYWHQVTLWRFCTPNLCYHCNSTSSKKNLANYCQN